jgi:hypothetical protein
MTSYLSSILFNWGGEINNGQPTANNGPAKVLSGFMHVLHECPYLHKCLE